MVFKIISLIYEYASYVTAKWEVEGIKHRGCPKKTWCIVLRMAWKV